MRAARVLLLIACALLLPCAQVTAQQAGKRPIARQAAAASPGRFHTEKLAEIDDAIGQNISSNKLPGGVLWLEREGVTYRKAYGNRAVFPKREAMTEDTIFDAASLTKVIATAPSIMILVERGQIELEEPVATYLPALTNNKTAITMRHLLTHTSGLRPGIPRDPDWTGYDKAIALACAETPTHSPGSSFRYSDINFILLGHIVAQVSRKSLDEFAAENIFNPLKMADTGFRPTKNQFGRIAPTVRSGNEVLRGTVHDPTARRMGGIAGHAGLFTTASDLARFARCMLNEGELDGTRILRPETARLMRSVQTPQEMQVRRGLGWDIDSPYAGPRGDHLPVGSFGHTGWTGTSLWMDPFSRTFVIFLSNRNHPDESGSVLQLRNRIGTLAAEAVRDFNFVYVAGALERRVQAAQPAEIPTAQVLNGIDVLKKNKFSQVRGLKVGLITNHTGADRERNPTIDLLHAAEGVQLMALFSPEHGIRGLVDEKVSDSKDEKTGLPIYSLYGERRT
ncbi:MAG: serine hydrolase, partial [Limisphaerales bacterium]